MTDGLSTDNLVEKRWVSDSEKQLTRKNRLLLIHHKSYTSSPAYFLRMLDLSSHSVVVGSHCPIFAGVSPNYYCSEESMAQGIVKSIPKDMCSQGKVIL